MMITPQYVETIENWVYSVKSGIIITTGGTTMSATLIDRKTSRPRKRMRAIAKAASAAKPVARTTEPALRIALFASLLTLSDVRLAQLAPVWALGVSRQRLSDLEVGKVLVLAAITAVLAVPLGLVLAWCLVAIVNVQAFGWRLPLHVFPLQWILIFMLALVTAFLAAILPVVRLARTSPAELLKVFANER